MIRTNAVPGTRLATILIFGVLLFMSTGAAFAGSASLTWNAPTTNTDGTP